MHSFALCTALYSEAINTNYCCTDIGRHMLNRREISKRDLANFTKSIFLSFSFKKSNKKDTKNPDKIQSWLFSPQANEWEKTKKGCCEYKLKLKLFQNWWILPNINSCFLVYYCEAPLKQSLLYKTL